MSLFSIKLPRYENVDKERGDENKKTITKMEQFYSNFLQLDKEENFFTKFFSGLPRVTLEIASKIGQGDISFYVSVPSNYENLLSKYVQGIYSGAIVEKVSDDYTIFEPKGEVSVSYLKQKNTFFLPTNTYQDLDKDPLEPLINSISDITPDEGAAIQIVARPLSFDLRRKGEKILEMILKEGKSFKEAISKSKKSETANLFADLLGPNKKENKDDENNGSKKSKVDEVTIELVNKKINKPGFETNIRLVGTAKDKKRSEEILSNLEGSFSQFTSAFNGFDRKKVKGKKSLKKIIYDFSFRNFKKDQICVLNSEELASVYHFPCSGTESPYVEWVKSAEAPPPSELPQNGELFLGEAVYRGAKKPVYVSSEKDRARHFYIIGQTGVGKSTIMREMIRQDIKNGKGVGVVDPHGDLVEDTLANIPKERVEDVVLFEPFDRERPCGLNMLEWDTPEQRDFSISEMIMIFGQLFDQSIIGPMFEYYMRNAIAALSADKDNIGTIAEIPRMFTDDTFMEEKLSKVSDHIVRNFWLKEWKQITGQTKSDMLGYVVSKIGRFVADETMRNIIGQQRSGFDLNKIMNEKKIFLANLSKGLTGELNSSLLGMILISKMQIAALRRAGIPEEARTPFYLYVDEFQNFTTESITVILSEARKYKLNLILAHQYMPQLRDEIKNAVIGNIGNMISYRVGIDDAEFLEKQFSPEFSKFDLSNIDNFQYVIKMMVNGKITSPFKVAAPVPSSGNREMAKIVKELSKLKYGKPKHLVEKEIKLRAGI
jgi:GTPase SAR1 family protein